MSKEETVNTQSEPSIPASTETQGTIKTAVTTKDPDTTKTPVTKGTPVATKDPDTTKTPVTKKTQNTIKTPVTVKTAKSCPNPQQLTEDYPEVFIDLETTGLGHNSHITQIAATGPNGTFAQYVTPKKPIEYGASRVTGLTFAHGQLFLLGKPVESVTWDKCLEDFLTYLGDRLCILVAHNARSFDSQVLVNAVLAVGCMSQLETRVAGFLDTLPLYRDVYPNLPNKYSQAALVKEFLDEPYAEHNALGDVVALSKLVSHCKFEPSVKQRHTFTLQYVKDNLRR